MAHFTYTYATLTTALRDFTEDQGSEFLSAIPTIIGLAETRLIRDLDLELLDRVATGTLSATNPFITKPTDLIQLRSLHYIDPSDAFKWVELEERSYGYIREYWPRNLLQTTPNPKFFCEYSDTQWLVAGTPSVELTWSARYIIRPDGLSATTTETWLSTRLPDALFYACLVTAEQFLKADGRAPMWGAEYARALEAARVELRRSERDDYMPMVATPVKEAE